MKRLLFRNWHRGGRRVSNRFMHFRSMSDSPVLTERGKTINIEQLFEYTNGRFLTDEAEARRRRYLKFDLEKLCGVVSSVCDNSPVLEIQKMEGGFSKALLMRMENGREVIAKLPFRIAGPPKYTTAAEIAVLRYDMHTSIPVPKLLTWNTDSTNSVGVEYIIMEKAPGTQLVKRWKSMSDQKKFHLVEALSGMENELAAIQFPAYGSLFLRESVSFTDKHELLDHSIDPSAEFCIGQSCDRAWDVNDDLSTKFNPGPWSNLSTFGCALVDREYARVQRKHEKEPSVFQRETLGEQLKVLNMTKEVMLKIDSATSLIGTMRPTLWHTDLHMGNIYVAENDPTKIVSIIDWQGVVISPLFLQARFPEFLSVEEDYPLGTHMPEQPQNYNDLDSEEKEFADLKLTNAKLSKAYELSTGRGDMKIFKARLTPWFLRDLFVRCVDITDDGVVQLRACLIELTDSWEEQGLSGQPPVDFDQNDRDHHNRQFDEFRRLQQLPELARKLLSTDCEGWVSPFEDFAMIQEQNKDLLGFVLEHSSQYGMSPDEVREVWPFKI